MGSSFCREVSLTLAGKSHYFVQENTLNLYKWCISYPANDATRDLYKMHCVWSRWASSFCTWNLQGVLYQTSSGTPRKDQACAGAIVLVSPGDLALELRPSLRPFRQSSRILHQLLVTNNVIPFQHPKTHIKFVVAHPPKTQHPNSPRSHAQHLQRRWRCGCQGGAQLPKWPKWLRAMHEAIHPRVWRI